ncbi:multiheme c-type cytochrome [Thermodesulfatator atlanticus]|uniref:multiheme c-type cytochrome n=1 Tax=Thermodesulfatator atlanticus TaxID=501497 RepID=UPI0003B6A42B|nr:multiheme c-type cytochrome [Thermodesulfatator atlanticus]
MRVRSFLSLSFLLALIIGVLGSQVQAKQEYTNLAGKKLVITRGYSKDAIKCIECHSKKTPGIVQDWKMSRMAHAGVSCYDCHVVPKGSPMASQCEGVKGTNIFTSPMVSPKTCAKCHPSEVEQFTKSAHAAMASRPVLTKFVKLWRDLEGGVFAGMDPKSKLTTAPRQSGCQACHGAEVKLGPDNKPTKDSWPGGIGHRYPDGGIGNCVVCHNRHKFSVAEARKPEACGKCHLGPDHPNIEIYYESAHGQRYLTEGEEWKWDAAPDAWEPGDYSAPTCATCHMSGIGELATTHNVTERLKWDLVHKKSVIRSGERGDGERGRILMRKVCVNCHSKVFVDAHFNKLDNSVALYNFYWDKVTAMVNDLKQKGLLKKDKWSDPVQELTYYFWHHVGRRARHGAAMAGPDYAHWHGFFQLFQVYKDIQALYNYRMKHGKIEELSPVMSSAPY